MSNVNKIAAFFILLPFVCLGQFHDNNIIQYVVNWDNQGSLSRLIDYKQHDTITYENLNNSFFISGTNVSMSDSSGQLLFVCNGLKVYNNSFLPMINGDSINKPDLFSDKKLYNSATLEGGYDYPTSNAIPLPGNKNQYVFFHNTYYIDEYGREQFALKYSRIDMNIFGGLGQVVEKNELIQTKSCARPELVKHGNGVDWWLVSADARSDTFSIYLITDQGIIGPKKQVAGTRPDPTTKYSILYDHHMIRFAPNGLILASQKRNFVDFFSFDRCTGDLKFTSSVDQNNVNQNSTFRDYIVTTGEFSSNSENYYFTIGRSYYQIHIDSGSINPNMYKLGHITFNSNVHFMTRMARGKIITFRNGDLNNFPYVGLITEPDLPGQYCQLDLNLFETYPTPSPNIYMSDLPYSPNYLLSKVDHFEIESCKNVFFDQALFPAEDVYTNGILYRKLLRKFVQ